MQELEEEYDEDESSEISETKDYTGIPIEMTCVVEIVPREANEHSDDNWSVRIDYSAKPGVSCGGLGGQYGGFKGTYEEALAYAKESCEKHGDWYISYMNPDTKEHYKIDRKVNITFIVNGVKTDTKNQGLGKWF